MADRNAPWQLSAVQALALRHSGRSWWSARYYGGKVLNEWDTAFLRLPGFGGSRSRWEEIPKKGMQALRLLCPNGAAGELEDTQGRPFFQLKCGGFILGKGQFCDAHVIGLLDDLEGNCTAFAWEMQAQRLIRFKDNVQNMLYRQIGKICLDHVGIRI